MTFQITSNETASMYFSFGFSLETFKSINLSSSKRKFEIKFFLILPIERENCTWIECF